MRDNREYRSMPMLSEKREEGTSEKTYIVEGYASTFDEYLLFRDGDEEFWERIETDAFQGCDFSDVVFRIDHDGRVYARTRNDSIQLNVDNHGLYNKVDLSRSSSAKGLYEDIECGNYDRMSFAFTVTEDAIEHDQNAKRYTRVIKRVGKLYDISPVSFPANPNTEIGISMRSAFDGFIEEEKRLELVKAEKERLLEEAKKKFMEVQ